MADAVEVIIIDDHPVVGDGSSTCSARRHHARPLVPDSSDHVLEEARSCGIRLALLDLDLGWTHETGLDLIAPLQADGIRAVVYSATRDRRLLGLALRPAPSARSRRRRGSTTSSTR